jgi:parallel beta-helix repeat protein
MTHAPGRRYSGVRQQQGRVQLDADWNEESAIRSAETVALARGVGGRAWLAQETPDAFLVGLLAGPPVDLSLGEGRLWLEGHGAAILPGEGVTYRNQPFYPAPPPINAGVDRIVYLDHWQREVTWVEAPALLDVALGGLDTTTRVQDVWQVKILETRGVPAVCGVDLDAAFPPSAGRLSTAANAPPAPDDPCIVPPLAGYRGIENRHYRLEVHVGGGLGVARFKWSRDAGAIISRVTAVAVAGGQTRISVNRIGRDEVLRFRIGDWVTLSDDHRDFHGEAGEMARVVDIDEAARVVVVDRALPGGGRRAFGANAGEIAVRNTRLQRWDQRAPVNVLDADGLMTAAAGPIALEDGIEVDFSVAVPGGQFRVGDYWLFAARTADASVEELDRAPPRGIIHRYLQLAAITAGGVVTDCRPKPEAGEGCCTFVVAPGGDIQAAIDALPPAGGCVCLKAGGHFVGAPISIRRDGVSLHGESRGAFVQNRGDHALLRIERATATRIQGIAFQQIEAVSEPAIIVVVAEDTAIEDCLVTTLSAGETVGLHAVGAEGLQLSGVAFRETVLGVVLDRGATDVRLEACRFDSAEPTQALPLPMAVAAIRARGSLDIIGCTVRDAASGFLIADSPIEPRSAVAACRVVGNRLRLRASASGERHYGVLCAAVGALVEDNLIIHDSADATAIWMAARDQTARGNRILARQEVPGFALAIAAGQVDNPQGYPGIAILDNRVRGAQQGIWGAELARSEIVGNVLGGDGVRLGVGIVLQSGDDCRIEGNSIEGAFAGITLVQGARNIVSANRVTGGEVGIGALQEIALSVADNQVLGATLGGIGAAILAFRFSVRGNRVWRCGSDADPGVGIGASLVLGEWEVSGNEVMDTGLPLAPGGKSAPAAYGILGQQILEGRVESNRVGYTDPLSRPTLAEDRALYVGSQLSYTTGRTVVGYPLQVVSNNFTGCGRTALVEVPGARITDTQAIWFADILYTGNHHWHWCDTQRQGTATVKLAADRLVVSGNRVKATTKGFPSWDLGGRPGPYLGNVSDGSVVDRVGLASQFPAPASAFNLF